MVALSLITLVAAIVNGAIGYGFSSITVPLALLVVGNRRLNPPLVLLELGLNGYVLWSSRHALPRVWRASAWIIAGLVPGVVLGTAALTHVDPEWVRLTTFLVLLPLILLQTVGYRRAVRSRRAVGVAFGGGLGALYAITTISGPPLAMFLNNQGYAKQDFRAGLGMVRFAESAFTAALYLHAGLFAASSALALVWMLPSVAIGLPVGVALIRRMNAETFRRACMSVDAAIVAFGVSTFLRALHVIDGSAAYLPFAAVLAFDAVALYRYLRVSVAARPASVTASSTASTV
ncbi:MAG TPA: sulfite exporter TauE/SafE family protein [Gemmatimonadaceae bacterium]|nr:sulfite exporter TauE/SafE family protein [Gemmatimonadaceae bacterium]